MRTPVVLLAVLVPLLTDPTFADDPPHPLMQWVKRHPLPDAKHPSPRLGYEASCGYDPASRLLIRYGGHNQGGGGEQNTEIWTYDLDKDQWAHMLPDDAPPGVCCAQQNVFHDALDRFIRFPAFSGSHGWQSFREIHLKNSSVWTYDLTRNSWKALRPSPEVFPAGLRGAAYDPASEAVIIHGGETTSYGTVVYDLYANEWQRMNPKPAPDAGLSQPGFALDTVNGVCVLFGSQFHNDPRTWLYSLKDNTWRILDATTHPPADKTSPVLAADTRNGIILCSVNNGEAHETWALDVKAAQWTKLNLPAEPEYSGSRNRLLIYLPDRNLFVLENRTKNEQQMLTFRYREAAPLPPKLGHVQLTTAADSALLTWEPPDERRTWTYTVHRAQSAHPWNAQFKPIAQGIRETRFVDRDVSTGTIHLYRVSATADDGTQAGDSFLARTRPPLPDAPVVSVASPKRIELRWAKASAEDVVGYHIERAEVNVYTTSQYRRIAQRYPIESHAAVGRIRQIGAFVQLTQHPAADPLFIDTNVDLAAGMKASIEPAVSESRIHKDELLDGRPYPLAVYTYRIRAVNRLGVASGPSPLVFTIPSAVKKVFAKEEGRDQTRLKWAANPEAGLKGYLVYRHDGRYDKNPIVRLTPRPIAATEFLDPSAGTSTRRYEIVAVDALDQEGEPSQPVWSRREWARFYVPYVGEWHQ